MNMDYLLLGVAVISAALTLVLVLVLIKRIIEVTDRHASIINDVQIEMHHLKKSIENAERQKGKICTQDAS